MSVSRSCPGPLAAALASDRGGVDARRAGPAPDAGRAPTTDTAPEQLLQGGGGACIVPRVAARDDGTTWLSWYQAARDGGPDAIRLQRLDVTGGKQLAADGVVVGTVDATAHVIDYALVADRAGDALVAYAARDGAVRVQRFDADGAPRWGATGAALTSGSERALALHAAVCGDGTLVVAWDWSDGAARGGALQRVDATGVARWATPARITGTDARQATGVRVVASDGADVIAIWREGHDDAGGDAYAQRFDGDGKAAWPARVGLNGDGPLPSSSVPALVTDGAGGVYAAWAVVDGARVEGRVQHLGADGAVRWAPGGVALTRERAASQVPRALATARDRVVVAWHETDREGNPSGLFVQAFDAAGAPCGGAGGVALIAAGLDEGGVAAGLRATAGGVALFHAFAPPDDLAVRAGVAMIALPLATAPPPTRVTLSDVRSGKSDPDVSALVGGGHWLVWSDERRGRPEIWGAWWPAS